MAASRKNETAKREPYKAKTPKRKRRTAAEQRAVNEARAMDPREPKKRSPARDKRQQEKQARRRAARGRPNGEKVMCGGTNLYGGQCKRPPLVPGREIDGQIASGDFCLFHEPGIEWDEVRRRVLLDPATQAIRKKPKLAKPTELLADAVAQAPGILFRAHLATLGLKWDADTQQIVPNGKGGAKIVGFSRDGYARRSRYNDLNAMREAERHLADRLWGKPRTSMDIGMESGAAAVVVPSDPERNQAVARVLIEAGAVNPAKPVATDGDAELVDGNDAD